MKNIHRILAAVDFSEHSKEVMEYAVYLANKLGADLIIANVINQREVDAIKTASLTTATVSFPEYMEEVEKDRLERMEELIEDTFCSHLAVKKLVVTGVPYNELLQIAKNENPELIVMGTRGRNLINMLLGSTADKVFRHSTVPVLSIRNR